jgi:hypothetical protein
LASTFLRHAEAPRILDLCMNPIAEPSSLILNLREVRTSDRGAQTKDIFHYENFGLEVIDVTKKRAIKAPAAIDDKTPAMVGSINLPRRTEALTRWPANDHINVLSTNHAREFLRPKAT